MTAPNPNGRRRRLIQALIGLTVLALAAWLLLRITADTASRRPAAAASAPAAPVNTQTSAPRAAAQSGPATPLERVASIATATPTPSDPAALATRFNDLATRARAGDADAAMQLHRGTMRCRQLQRSRALARPVDVAAARAAPEPWQLEAKVMACLDRPLCAGITANQLHDPTQWLVHAAHAGDRDARAWFAAGPVLQWNGLDAMAYAPVLRDNGLRWLQEGAAAGHRLSLEILGHAYLQADGSFGELVASLVPQDRVRGAAYLLAARLAAGDPDAVRKDLVLRGLPQAMPEPQWRAALQLSAELQAGLTDDRPFEEIEQALNTHLYGPHALPADPEAQLHPDCISAAAATVLRERVAMARQETLP